MTAEIAILNKTAVALAADSAVTILAGDKEEKIFNTADKLFELSNKNPIGIMIYNVTNFMEAPLSSLIKKFRNHCAKYDKVEEVARAFFNFLDEFGKDCDNQTKLNNIGRIIDPITDGLAKKIAIGIQQGGLKGEITKENAVDTIDKVVDEAIRLHEGVFSKSKKASFIGKRPFSISSELVAELKSIISKKFDILNASQRRRLLKILRSAIDGDIPSQSHTGIVIAGFGTNEIFPTLLSFRIDGMVCDRLKYVKTNHVDVDRRGVKAKVLPFAQREMVDRFSYGLDSASQTAISDFCTVTLPKIRQKIMETLVINDDNDRDYLIQEIKVAEKAFLDGLNDEAFKEIREKSEGEIEAMVEFMPKPELAQMAEALVELTSIKRRVSRGMETVGGPIDVAVISQSLFDYAGQSWAR